MCLSDAAIFLTEKLQVVDIFFLSVEREGRMKEKYETSCPSSFHLPTSYEGKTQ